MTFETLFFVLSVLGIIDAGYLTYKHTRKQPLICPIGDDCSVVTESKWSHLLGVRVEVLGLLYYGALFLGMLTALFLPGYHTLLVTLLFAATGLGLMFSVFLVGIQTFAIKKYCFYCLMSALISLLLFFTGMTVFLS